MIIKSARAAVLVEQCVWLEEAKVSIMTFITCVGKTEQGQIKEEWLTKGVP